MIVLAFESEPDGRSQRLDHVVHPHDEAQNVHVAERDLRVRVGEELPDGVARAAAEAQQLGEHRHGVGHAAAAVGRLPVREVGHVAAHPRPDALWAGGERPYDGRLLLQQQALVDQILEVVLAADLLVHQLVGEGAPAQHAVAHIAVLRGVLREQRPHDEEDVVQGPPQASDALVPYGPPARVAGREEEAQQKRAEVVEVRD
mmetsp:Transcript_86290/g.225120  ORF Transcript_86290/g.225120 Transcript_86290/m.225120 type:complete len:202 (+) Transcript_86290:466-1071(+)